jgi:hypothetical protein
MLKITSGLIGLSVLFIIFIGLINISCEKESPTDVDNEDSSRYKLKTELKGKTFKPGDTLTIKYDGEGPKIKDVFILLHVGSGKIVPGKTINLTEDRNPKTDDDDWGIFKWIVQEEASTDEGEEISLLSDKVRITVCDDPEELEISQTSDYFTIEKESTTEVENPDSSWYTIKTEFKGKTFKPGDTITIEYDGKGPKIRGVFIWLHIGTGRIIPTNTINLTEDRNPTPDDDDWGIFKWVVKEKASTDEGEEISLLSDKVRITVLDYLAELEISYTSDYFTISK